MDRRRRSLVKSFTWRLVGVLILGLITYLMTRNWEQTTGITLIFHSIRLVLYYYHERIWEGIEWGRSKHPLAHLRLRQNLAQEDYEAISRLLQEREYLAAPPEYEI